MCSVCVGVERGVRERALPLRVSLMCLRTVEIHISYARMSIARVLFNYDLLFSAGQRRAVVRPHARQGWLRCGVDYIDA